MRAAARTLLLSGLLAGAPAGAEPVALSVDPAQSGADVVITVTVIGSDSDAQTVSWSGGVSADATITFAGGVGQRLASLDILSSSISQSDASFSLDPGVPLTIDLVGWQGQLEGPGGPLLGVAAGAPHTSSFDLDGVVLTFDVGLLDLGLDSLDLSEAPFPFPLGPGDTATAVTQPAGAALETVVTIPISVSTSVTEMGVTVELDVDGTLVLTGSLAALPLPGLSPVGLAGLAAVLALGARAVVRRQA